MTQAQYKLLFLIASPILIIVIGILTKFNYILIVAGALACFLGILFSPIVSKFFNRNSERAEVIKAKSINVVITFFGGILFAYLFMIDESIENVSTVFVFGQLAQYFLTGATLQALYTYYIE